jgi:hypothetical protein
MNLEKKEKAPAGAFSEAYKIQDTRYKIQDTRYKILNTYFNSLSHCRTSRNAGNQLALES